ncbi:MAG: tyrosine--tRNA ligase [Parachlamydiaceae bacterium]
MNNLIDVLKERGFIDALTSDDLKAHLDRPAKVYCGFDPSADSLHLGNLVAIMALAWFQRFGHTPVVIVGGATGMIGDPSGKSIERNLLDEATIQKNLQGIRKNLETVLRQGATPPVFLNNFDWFKSFSFIDFLRDVGKLFRMGPMLGKESVRARMESEEGMSFTEFCYQILQSYDFLHLFEKHQVTVQVGGSDQWGNITGGVELIRKVKGKEAFGITFPLLLKSDGQKFGKSEKGAVWLSPEKLSPYDFYQHLYRTADEDVIKLFRMLTFLEMSEIRKIESEMASHPNAAQKRLAQEVTKLVHGEDAMREAERVTASAKPGAKTELDLATLNELVGKIPTVEMGSEEVFTTPLIEILVKNQLLPSKGEARKMIANRGVYLNNQTVEDSAYQLQKEDFIGGEILLVAVGKKQKILLKIAKSA